MSIVTFLSDFGSNSPYLAEMKAVVAGLCDATFIDISHDVRRHDVRMGAYLLACVAPRTPAGAVHVAVVDPGVGTERRPLIVAAGGQYFVGPDNGLLFPAAKRLGTPRVYAVTAPEILGPYVSTTFHGRDIFAPAAGHLVHGTPPEALGHIVTDWVDLEFGTGRRDGLDMRGEIIYVDPFGNMVTNIPSALLNRHHAAVTVAVGHRSVAGVVAQTYGHLARNTVGVVPGSDGMLEIAVREGDAAARFAGVAGDQVLIRTGQVRSRPGKGIRRARKKS